VTQNAGKLKYLKNWQFLKKDSAPWVSYSNKLILHFLIFGKFSKKRVNEGTVVWRCSGTYLGLPFEVTQLSVRSWRVPLDTLQQKEQASLHINTATSCIKNVSTSKQIMRYLDRRFATHDLCFYAQNPQ
jgi:hypothetical protein